MNARKHFTPRPADITEPNAHARLRQSHIIPLCHTPVRVPMIERPADSLFFFLVNYNSTPPMPARSSNRNKEHNLLPTFIPHNPRTPPHPPISPSLSPSNSALLDLKTLLQPSNISFHPLNRSPQSLYVYKNSIVSPRPIHPSKPGKRKKRKKKEQETNLNILSQKLIRNFILLQQVKVRCAARNR